MPFLIAKHRWVHLQWPGDVALKNLSFVLLFTKACLELRLEMAVSLLIANEVLWHRGLTCMLTAEPLWCHQTVHEREGVLCQQSVSQLVTIKESSLNPEMLSEGCLKAWWLFFLSHNDNTDSTFLVCHCNKAVHYRQHWQLSALNNSRGYYQNTPCNNSGEILHTDTQRTSLSDRL